jgi:hypothetical protein
MSIPLLALIAAMVYSALRDGWDIGHTIFLCCLLLFCGLLGYGIHMGGKGIKAIKKSMDSQWQLLGINSIRIESEYKSRSQIQLDKINLELDDGNVFTRGMDEDDINGIWDIRDNDFDYVFYMIDHSYQPRGSTRNSIFLEYAVISHVTAIGITTKDTRMSVKDGSIYWKGDNSLSERLNLDNELGNLILQIQSQNSALKIRDFVIKNIPKRGYAVIRFPFYIPTEDDIKAVNIIARHIKSAWFG